MIHHNVLLLLTFILASSIKASQLNFAITYAAGPPNSVFTLSVSNSTHDSIMITPSSINPSTSSFKPADSTVSDEANTSAAQNLNVVTSVSPITNIVKNVGGNKIDLVGLVPEGVNSHMFELVPSDAVKVNNADLVVIDGLGLETNVEEVAEEAVNKNPQLQVLKLGDNTITQDQWVFDFSFPEEEGDPNPHLWLSAAYAIKFANLTRDKLMEMAPQNALYYSTNTDRYISILKNLDKGIMQAVQTVPPENRKLLTYHDSWAYFALRYNMKVIGAVQPSDFGEPTTQEVARIIDQIRSERVPAIFASEVFPTGVVDQIAKEGNVTIVGTLSDDDLPGDPGDPEHSYIGMMLINMKNMLVPLGGNITALNGIDPKDAYTPK
jgi:ABC-type Zn uptake system ZnuABC Zn-binding protein ZnuA